MAVGKVNLTNQNSSTRFKYNSSTEALSFTGNPVKVNVTKAEKKLISQENGLFKKFVEGMKDVLIKARQTLSSGATTRTTKAGEPHKIYWWEKFSSIEGEAIKDASTLQRTKKIKNEDGKVVREFTSDWRDIIHTVVDYEPKTGNKVKKTYFVVKGNHNDGITKRLLYVADYDPKTGNEVRKAIYDEYGNVCNIHNYDPKTGNSIKSTYYKDGSKKVHSVTDYDPKTGHQIKDTEFYEDGKTVFEVTDYDFQTRMKSKETIFNEDGKTVYSVRDFDPQTGHKIKLTAFNADGSVKSVENY